MKDIAQTLRAALEAQSVVALALPGLLTNITTLQETVALLEARVDLDVSAELIDLVGKIHTQALAMATLVAK